MSNSCPDCDDISALVGCLRTRRVPAVHTLPSDDQSPTPGLVPVDDEVAAAVDLGSISTDNPVAVAAAFLAAVCKEGGPDLPVLRLLVTPESLPAWGDFSQTVNMLTDCGIASRANPSDDPEVVYAKYVADRDGQNYQVQGGDILLMVRAVATLVRRWDLGGWRVHGVGQYIRPVEVPR